MEFELNNIVVGINLNTGYNFTLKDLADRSSGLGFRGCVSNPSLGVTVVFGNFLGIRKSFHLFQDFTGIFHREGC